MAGRSTSLLDNTAKRRKSALVQRGELLSAASIVSDKMMIMMMMMVMQEKWSHSRAASGSKRSDGSFSDSSNSFVRQVKLLTSHSRQRDVYIPVATGDGCVCFDVRGPVYL